MGMFDGLRMRKRISEPLYAASSWGIGHPLYADYFAWPSVWDGIYTASQASRGEAAYRANCASCHGVNLEARPECRR